MRTWKDFSCNCKVESSNCPLIEMREEAIKWVKKFESPGCDVFCLTCEAKWGNCGCGVETWENVLCEEKYECDDFGAVNKFLKHFFNIKDGE